MAAPEEELPLPGCCGWAGGGTGGAAGPFPTAGKPRLAGPGKPAGAGAAGGGVGKAGGGAAGGGGGDEAVSSEVCSFLLFVASCAGAWTWSSKIPLRSRGRTLCRCTEIACPSCVRIHTFCWPSMPSTVAGPFQAFPEVLSFEFSSDIQSTMAPALRGPSVPANRELNKSRNSEHDCIWMATCCAARRRESLA